MVRGKTAKTNKEWELAKTLIPVMSGERWKAVAHAPGKFFHARLSACPLWFAPAVSYNWKTYKKGNWNVPIICRRQ
jgi:hypothetical protein